jgi:hypothetical protein
MAASSQSGQLRHRRREAHPLLRGRHRTVALEGDAAETVGVAGGRRGQCRLVAAEEGVLRGVAAVFESTAGKVVDQTVAREGVAGGVDRLGQPGGAVMARLPPLEGIGSERRHHQLPVPLGERRVAEERQTRAARARSGRGQQGSQIPDRQDGRDRRPAAGQLDRVPSRVQADGAPPRQVGDGGALRQRNDIRGGERNQSAARPRGRPETIADLDRAVGTGDAEAHAAIVTGRPPPAMGGSADRGRRPGGEGTSPPIPRKKTGRRRPHLNGEAHGTHHAPGNVSGRSWTAPPSTRWPATRAAGSTPSAPGCGWAMTGSRSTSSATAPTRGPGPSTSAS